MLAVILVRLLLSPSGAIDRGAFVAGLVILIAAAIGIDRVMGSWSGPSGLASFAFALVFAWSAICLSRKRLHDFGWSGLMILAFLGLYLAAVLVAVFFINHGALASWQQALAAVTLFSGPMTGWLIALAIIPGNGLSAVRVRR